MTRTRRSIYALGASYLYTSVALVAGLVATPLLILWLGEERLGVVKVAQQWLGYALLLNLGLDATIAINFVNASAKRDREGIVAALRGAIRAYFTVALASMAWVIVLCLFAPSFFNLRSPELLPELRWGLMIAACGQFALLLATFKPLAEAEQRGYMSHLCLTGGALTGLILSLALAASGAGLIGQFIAITATPIVSGVLMAFDAVRRYPELLKHPAGQATHTVASFNRAMLTFQVCSRLSFISDCIIIDQILGTTSVLPYTSTAALMGIIQIFVLSVGNASWPALANLWKEGHVDTFHHRQVQLTRFVSVFACATIVPAAAWNRQFVLAWLNKPHLFGGELLTWLIAASLIISIMISLWALPFAPMGKIAKLVPLYLIGTVIALCTNITATYFLGLLGPPIALLVNMGLLLFPMVPRVMQREFGTSAHMLLKAAIGPMVLAVPYAVALSFIAGSFEVSDLVRGRVPQLAVITCLIGLAAAIYMILAALIVLPVADRREWLNRMMSRFRRSPQ